jgi:hypothetical protein
MKVIETMEVMKVIAAIVKMIKRRGEGKEMNRR